MSPLQILTAVTVCGMLGSVESTTTHSTVKVDQARATSSDMNLT